MFNSKSLFVLFLTFFVGVLSMQAQQFQPPKYTLEQIKSAYLGSNPVSTKFEVYEGEVKIRSHEGNQLLIYVDYEDGKANNTVFKMEIKDIQGEFIRVDISDALVVFTGEMVLIQRLDFAPILGYGQASAFDNKMFETLKLDGEFKGLKPIEVIRNGWSIGPEQTN